MGKLAPNEVSENENEETSHIFGSDETIKEEQNMNVQQVSSRVSSFH